MPTKCSTKWAMMALAISHTILAADPVTRTVSPPKSMPTDAVEVPADFVSFGFGSAWLQNYVATPLSENLIDSVAARMSVPPVIRIGGTVGDEFFFDPNQKEKRNCIGGKHCPNSSKNIFILGPSYFEDFKHFPNAKMTFQAPLGADVNLTNVRAYVTRAYEALGADRVDAIAIGNEVTKHDKSAEGYVRDAREMMKDIIAELGLKGDDKRIFEVVDSRTRSAVSHDAYAAKEVFDAGINHFDHVKYAAEHYYQIVNSELNWHQQDLQDYLMNHQAITGHLDKLSASINPILRQNPNVRYLLSETGAAIAGAPTTFSDRFGATLWSVDFNLAAMARKVSRVVDSGRPAARHASWVPDNSVPNHPGPSVRAPFTADPMIADFVGDGVSVSELSVPGSSPYMSAYAAYDTESGKLQRVALVNQHLWSLNNGDKRLKRVFDVEVGDVDEVKVRRLHADAGVEAGGFDHGGPSDNVTWAGEQWSWKVDQGKGHLVNGVAQVETVKVRGGVASITVPDSEAVIVFVR